MAEVLDRIWQAREAVAAAAGQTVDGHADELERIAAAERDGREARLRDLARTRARVPGCPYSGRERETEALGHARRWIASGGPLCVLCGGVGTGKSTAAAVVAYETELAHVQRLARDRGVWPGGQPAAVEVVTAVLLGRRADPWRQDLEAGIVPLRLDAPLLIVDDLGTETPGDRRFSDALFCVIDERQTGDFRTLITTNFKRADIRPRYGDRIADRMNHVGKAIEIRGDSMRRPGAL